MIQGMVNRDFYEVFLLLLAACLYYFIAVVVSIATYSRTLPERHNDRYDHNFQGCRAFLFDKDKKPKWNPPSLEQVTEAMVNRFFEDIDDPDLGGPLKVPHRPHDLITAKL
ncbi:hypothetical protein CRG98_047397 [Punica granatum]|uniref:3-hydroxyisobutyryl-CoA hydrolase n=1 Tax=Punica granatum TaxID=22663 RepID=A0A2I0HKF7_PUNGR|nr:hypothetical protein CRG98_047397 [Punica granatum]